MDALCFGSLNIDYTYDVPHFVSRGETLSSACLRVFSGGKGLNQSVALARAGARVFHAGAVGEDGRFLLDELQRAGVDTGCIQVRADVRTGHAVIQRDPAGDNCILLYGGANRAVSPAQADAALSRFRPGDLLVLQNEISALEHIIKRGKELGLRIALNPAPMDPSIPALPLEALDWLLLNEVEAAQLLGLEPRPDLDRAALARQIGARFPGPTVVLTLGAGGAVCLRADGLFFQPAFSVPVVDTTAAGDTFTGFFLAGTLEGMDPASAMELAAAAAALAVGRKGAAPSIPTREEVSRFLSSRAEDGLKAFFCT